MENPKMNYLIEIDALINIGILSVQWKEKEQAVLKEKYIYHETWKKFEVTHSPYTQFDVDEFGYVPERISQGHALYDEVIAYTKKEYESYKKARKEAYNAKRRLLNAISKSQGKSELWNKEKTK